jgi:hypothetical protein
MRKVLLTGAVFAVVLAAWIVINPAPNRDSIGLASSHVEASPSDREIDSLVEVEGIASTDTQPEVANSEMSEVDTGDATSSESAVDPDADPEDSDLELPYFLRPEYLNSPEYLALREAGKKATEQAAEQIKAEGVEPEWAPEMTSFLKGEVEAALAGQPELREKYSVVSVDCRTTACELLVHDYSSDQTRGRLDYLRMIRTLYADSLYENFGIDWFGLNSLQNGFYEDRLYFRRRTTPVDMEKVEEFRLPMGQSETSAE